MTSTNKNTTMNINTNTSMNINTNANRKIREKHDYVKEIV